MKTEWRAKITTDAPNNLDDLRCEIGQIRAVILAPLLHLEFHAATQLGPKLKPPFELVPLRGFLNFNFSLAVGNAFLGPVVQSQTKQIPCRSVCTRLISIQICCRGFQCRNRTVGCGRTEDEGRTTSPTIATI